MAVKIRLQRRGRKKLAIFDIVVADSRSPRDGKIIEKIGTYNPNHNPASIVLNNEKALEILQFKLDVLWALADAIMLQQCEIEIKGAKLK